MLSNYSLRIAILLLRKEQFHHDLLIFCEEEGIFFYAALNLNIFSKTVEMKLQLPTEVPSPDTNSPIDLNSPFDILVYIVAPVVLIVLYLYLRKKSRSQEEEDSSDTSDE